MMTTAGLVIVCIAIIVYGVVLLCYPELMEKLYKRLSPESLYQEGSAFRWSKRLLGLVFIVAGLAPILWVLRMILRR
jgi:uncharacterized protein YjeT (DUF2065 family)